MPHEESAELSKIRLENATMLLDSSRTLIEAGDYKSAANRSYYAVFAAMRSCLRPAARVDIQQKTTGAAHHSVHIVL